MNGFGRQSRRDTACGLCLFIAKAKCGSRAGASEGSDGVDVDEVPGPRRSDLVRNGGGRVEANERRQRGGTVVGETKSAGTVAGEMDSANVRSESVLFDSAGRSSLRQQWR